MLRVLLLDGVDSPELLAVLQRFVNDKGKALKLAAVDPQADLADPQSYRSALGRDGRRQTLSECLLAVQNAERARAAQLANALPVLHFADDAELPLLVAARIGSTANREAALAFYLQLREAVELHAVTEVAAERSAFRGLAWRSVTGEELAELSGVFVLLPVEGTVTLRADGGVGAVTLSEPSQDDVAEARSFVASLVQHGQVHTHIPGQRARGSHELLTLANGQRRLLRSRSDAR